MSTENIIESENNLGIRIEKVLYTGKVHVHGGRDGYAKSQDGLFNWPLSSPGSSGKGTNPEQLFAAGWSACFIGAMKHNAPALKIALPEDTDIDTEVDLALAEGGFALQARLNVSLPGLTIEQARTVVEAAHKTCPYSKATRGNINVEINVTI